MMPRICLECEITYQPKERESKFCSRSCSVRYNNRKRTHSEQTKIKIATSIRSIARPPLPLCVICSQPVSQRKRKTCSRDCMIKLHKQNGQKGGLISQQVRPVRSKNEILFYELCAQYFNNVGHNECIFNGWDADVLIYDHKIAVLWNGDWHYREMHCYNHSLKSVQNRDKHKLKLIHKEGWIAFIVKDTDDNPTSPQQAFAALLEMVPQRRIERR